VLVVKGLKKISKKSDFSKTPLRDFARRYEIIHRQER